MNARGGNFFLLAVERVVRNANQLRGTGRLDTYQLLRLRTLARTLDQLAEAMLREEGDRLAMEAERERVRGREGSQANLGV